MIRPIHPETPAGIHPPGMEVYDLTGRPYLSWSQLTSYRSCPRKWFFSHVENAKPEFIASSLIFGGAIHKAIQRHYDARIIGRDLDLEHLQASFDEAWQEEEKRSVARVRYGKDESKESLKELAGRMLQAFQESPLTKLPGPVVAVEDCFTARIHPDMPDVLARVDVIYQDDDGMHLLDAKTSRSRWSQGKVAESADQLLLYGQLIEQAMPEEKIHLHFGVITKAKTPVVEIHDLPASTNQAENVVKIMLPVWQAMRQGVDFASPSAMNCSTCPFQSQCPACHK